MKIQGKVKVIGEVQEIGSKGFKKRELVITFTSKRRQPYS